MRKTPSSSPLLSRSSWPEVSRVTVLLRKETVGGALLLIATVAALACVTSPWSEAYFGLRDLQLGPAALHLNLSVGAWVTDGLLAIFFFVVGLELGHQFVAGDLRDLPRAALPIAAAIGGRVRGPIGVVLSRTSGRVLPAFWRGTFEVTALDGRPL